MRALGAAPTGPHRHTAAASYLFEGVSFSLQTEVQNVLSACACRVVWGNNQGLSNRLGGSFGSPWSTMVHLRCPSPRIDSNKGWVGGGGPPFFEPNIDLPVVENFPKNREI